MARHYEGYNYISKWVRFRELLKLKRNHRNVKVIAKGTKKYTKYPYYADVSYDY